MWYLFYAGEFLTMLSILVTELVKIERIPVILLILRHCIIFKYRYIPLYILVQQMVCMYISAKFLDKWLSKTEQK
jgi:hypothetical protein